MSDGETANKKAVGIETLSSSATDGAFLTLNPAHYGLVSYCIVTENAVASHFLSLSDIYQTEKRENKTSVMY